MSRKIIMTVLGAEAVGKTTLLATMYSQLARINNSQGFFIKAIGDTGTKLQEAREKLDTIIDEPNFSDISRLIPGSQGITEHKFMVYFNNKETLSLSFYDHAGGILLEDEENSDFKDFKRILTQADVVVNVIDGATLMEGSEPYSMKVNKASRVMELLHLTTQNNKPNLVLFVITKCEYWLKDEGGKPRPQEFKQQLQTKFEERHQEVLGCVRGQQNVVGLLVPVETLGCVRFAEIEGYNKPTERIKFTKNPLLQFKPDQVEQPLLYTLIFSMVQHLDNWSWWKKMFHRSDYTAMIDELHKLQEKHCNKGLKSYGYFPLIEI